MAIECGLSFDLRPTKTPHLCCRFLSSEKSHLKIDQSQTNTIVSDMRFPVANVLMVKSLTMISARQITRQWSTERARDYSRWYRAYDQESEEETREEKRQCQCFASAQNTGWVIREKQGCSIPRDRWNKKMNSINIMSILTAAWMPSRDLALKLVS